MKDFLKRHQILPTNTADKVVWCGSVNGNYSVKVGYQLLDSDVEEAFWAKNLCWSKECLPKAGAFAWLAVKGRILSRERRKRLGLAGPTKCVLCDEAEESTDHLILHCKVASSCWDALRLKLGWKGPWQNTVKGVFEGWPRPSGTSLFSSVWVVSPSIVIWELWKERNRRIF